MLTIPTSATQEMPHTTWTSLSDHERILRRVQEKLTDNMQAVDSENRRLSREIRQRTLEALESTSSTTLTEEDEFFEERRRQNRLPRVPPRPQVDLPPYQERDPYPITGYSDMPVDVPMEGMV